MKGYLEVTAMQSARRAGSGSFIGRFERPAIVYEISLG
jgi:hypothetical protein